MLRLFPALASFCPRQSPPSISPFSDAGIAVPPYCGAPVLGFAVPPSPSTAQPSIKSGNVFACRNDGRATRLLLLRVPPAVPPRSPERLEDGVAEAVDEGKQKENARRARRPSRLGLVGVGTGREDLLHTPV